MTQGYRHRLSVAILFLVAALCGAERYAASASKRTRALAHTPETVNINLANQDELERLYQIGPHRAAAIVDYRKEYAKRRKGRAFHVPGDLSRVPGIGKGIVTANAPWITVDQGTTLEHRLGRSVGINSEMRQIGESRDGLLPSI